MFIMLDNLIKMSKTFLRFFCKSWYNATKENEERMSKMSVTNEATVFGEVDSVDFAIYLNKKAHDLNIPVNVTKIQKWLYICYGLYFAINGEQLLTERPKAWDYGPVFPRVHKRQKKNNNSLDNLSTGIPLEKLKKYDDVIQATLKNFGDWTANELVAWTHEDGKAWSKTYHLLDAKYAPMDNHDISLDFKSLFTNG